MTTTVQWCRCNSGGGMGDTASMAQRFAGIPLMRDTASMARRFAGIHLPWRAPETGRERRGSSLANDMGVDFTGER